LKHILNVLNVTFNCIFMQLTDHNNDLVIYGLWRASCPEFHASQGEAP